jgi:hypothetical protein
MGYIRHDAIIATSWDKKYLRPALAKAEELGLDCSEIVDSGTNGYCHFLIAPDGSKEGWPESDKGDEARLAWKNWADDAWTKDNLYVYWVHVGYAGDEYADTKIIQQARRKE